MRRSGTRHFAADADRADALPIRARSFVGSPGIWSWQAAGSLVQGGAGTARTARLVRYGGFAPTSRGRRAYRAQESDLKAEQPTRRKLGRDPSRGSVRNRDFIIAANCAADGSKLGDRIRTGETAAAKSRNTSGAGHARRGTAHARGRGQERRRRSATWTVIRIEDTIGNVGADPQRGR